VCRGSQRASSRSPRDSFVGEPLRRRRVAVVARAIRRGHADAGEPEGAAFWERRDPVNRLRGYLRHRGVWGERWEAELVERHEQQITEALAAAEHKPAPPVDSLFDDVYDELPWHLREQRAYLAAQPRTASPHHR